MYLRLSIFREFLPNSSMIKKLIHSSLRIVGYDISKYPSPEIRNKQLTIRNFKINKIFDVGANAGQFSADMRNHGFKGDIVSFEPLSSAFTLLKERARSDRNWLVRNSAIGDIDGNITIHVAKNSYSSSIREMLPAHLDSAAESAFISEEQVEIRKFDSIFHEYYKEGDNILLKIDTQGYEKNVLEGAEKSLKHIKGISLEMSLIPLYKGEMLFWEMVPYLQQKGFTLYMLESEFTNPTTGKLLQVNGIFYRE